jgi:hypothetical protein
MTKTRRAKLRIFASIFLTMMMVGIGSSAVPATYGTVTPDEIIAAGTIDSAIALGGGIVNGNFVSFDVASVDLTSVDLSSVPSDLLPFVDQVINDVNSGAVSGTVSFDMTDVNSIPVDGTTVSMDVILNFRASELVASMLNGKNEADGAILAASAKRSDIVSTLSFAGTARIGRGFGPDNPVLAEVPSRSSMSLGFEQAADKQSIHTAHADRWVVPGVGFRGGNITMQNSGKTPKRLRKFEKNRVALDNSAIQFDAVSRTISARHQFSIKRKAE